ncbi:hypothetical protein BG000_009598 [Podila horticola]|nr:hypothetical protein BG000_009598 [Podila horticola]
MSNKPTAKAIAKLNASTLFPEIRKELVANPSMFAIHGFFIFNITKKGVPMTEWQDNTIRTRAPVYLLLQGFDMAPILSQKRPEIPKVKRDEQPVPVAILQIEDSDLLNFMSGGLTGPRGIVSGKIKIAGAIELAEQLEEVFRKAKGPEKTLAYLDAKRLKSNSQLSSSPASSTLEHKPMPAAQSKVHDLARRYSAMAKQTGETLALPADDKPKGGSFGRSDGSKISGLMGKFKESATIAESAPNRAPSMPLSSRFTAPKQMGVVKVEELVEVGEVDIEQEIESSLQVSEQAEKVQLDLVDVPLSGDRGEDRNLDLDPTETVLDKKDEALLA